MSLVNQVKNLATRVGTEFKSVRGTIGNLPSLATTEKGSLVGAINEVQAGIGAGGTVTVDAITDATAVGKGLMKATSPSNARGVIGAGTSDLVLGPTASDAKPGNYVPTWGEVSGKPVVIAAGADQTTARAAIGAQSASDVATAISNLVDGSPAALDTLNELAAAIGDDPNFATTMSTALGNRVRVDAAQAFTEPQKVQGRANLDVYSKTELGDPETDFVTVFEAALV